MIGAIGEREIIHTHRASETIDPRLVSGFREKNDADF
jgi:hypothetical protein